MRAIVCSRSNSFLSFSKANISFFSPLEMKIFYDNSILKDNIEKYWKIKLIDIGKLFDIKSIESQKWRKMILYSASINRSIIQLDILGRNGQEEQ